MNIGLRTAEQIMTKELVTIAPSATLRAAAALMTQRHVHCLLVPATDPGRCVGVITIKDIVQIMCDSDTLLLDQLRVADSMTAPALSVQKDFAIADCMLLMRMSGVRSVPVLDGTKLVGLLSFTDIVRTASQA